MAGRPAVQARPQRTCVGCKARAAKSELLRVVVTTGGEVPTCVPDPSGRLAGRGASVHRDPQCLDLAERRRAFSRALRVAGPVDTAAVRRYVEEWAARTRSNTQEPQGR
ncbi:MAG: YlxR family protein [Actinomycetota bacterium]|nr:YlxR family protein [Acidothermales bacterium]MDQ3432074.1 YlxR family protein [Actinomycetota bacterium]